MADIMPFLYSVVVSSFPEKYGLIKIDDEIILYTEANASGDAGSTSNPNGFVANTYPVLLLEYFVDAIQLETLQVQ